MIKWDPFVTQWYVVTGMKGTKVAAFNEISASVLAVTGLISISSDTGDAVNTTYLVGQGVPSSLYTNSILLTTQAQKDWLKNQIGQYGVQTLLWRGSVNGYNLSALNAAMQNQGPSITIF